MTPPVRESEVVAAILHRYARHPKVRLWRQNTGAARTARGGLVRFGLPGQSDLQGVISGGRALFIECKSPTGRQSEAQRAFQGMVECVGGLYVLARTVGDVAAILEPLLTGTL